MIKENAPYRTADHAPCMHDSQYRCSLKTKLKDYYKENEGTKNEVVYLDEERYDGDICAYFHQRNEALTASHSVLNYSMFLSLLGLFPVRNLLICDEAHELPSEVLKFQSFSITKNRWQKYMGIDFQIPNLGFDDVKGWIEFLIRLKETILRRIRVNNSSEMADIERKILELSYNKSDQSTIVRLQERLKELSGEVDIKLKNLPVEAREDMNRLDSTISTIISEPLNWIVTELKFDVISKEIAKVVFKPFWKTRPILSNSSNRIIVGRSCSNTSRIRLVVLVQSKKIAPFCLVSSIKNKVFEDADSPHKSRL
jgi:Rad3-related DNA helicase